MPKATKKKKEKVEDFKKAKLKLGKGKKQASNATDTSFKARSIALPSQKQLSRALAREGEESTETPTTASGLTLDDVLVQLRHVNAGVRRESLNHLKEVLQAGVRQGSGFGERHGEVSKVVRAIGGMISDDDGHARKALHQFVEWYISRLPRTTLVPYLPLLELQIASALSHIYPAVRLDACKVVEILLESHPGEVIGSWPAPNPSGVGGSGSTIFEGLRLSAGLGGEKGASTQGGFRMTPGSKLVILRTIGTFIAKALEPLLATPTFSRPEPKFGEFTLQDLEVMSAAGPWSLGQHEWAVQWQDTDVGAAGDIASPEALEEISRTYLSLHSLLVATFMEAAPSAFSPSASATVDQVSLDLCSVCVDLVTVCARALLPLPEFSSLENAKELRSAFAEFLKRMAAYFPFSQGAASAAADTTFGMSLNYAKLAVALAPTAEPIEPQSSWKRRVRAIEQSWRSVSSKSDTSLTAAADWVAECLEPSSDALVPQLSPQSYTELLPVVRSLILRPATADLGGKFLQAVLRQPSASAKRRQSDAFLISVFQTHEDRWGTTPFFVPPSSPFRELFRKWLGSAPKTLWELGNKDQDATEQLLRFLLDLGRRGANGLEKPYSLIEVGDLEGLAAKLGPFFWVSQRSMLGPWGRLDDKVQKLALDVARTWLPLDERLGEAVSQAAEERPWAKAYWMRS